MNIGLLGYPRINQTRSNNTTSTPNFCGKLKSNMSTYEAAVVLSDSVVEAENVCHEIGKKVPAALLELDHNNITGQSILMLKKACQGSVDNTIAVLKARPWGIISTETLKNAAQKGEGLDLNKILPEVAAKEKEYSKFSTII